MKTIGEKDFETAVLKSAAPVLLDFSAEWCAPCKAQVPILEKLAGELTGKLEIFTIDIDAEPGLAGRFKVLSVPTLILFHRGEIAKRWTGRTDLATLKQAVEACA